ncbi:MAG: hypothetical protein OXE50_15065, partial [Chloroflexi bacterium]|nr:hypothetical protein [Chloroflexota bacterium]
DEAPSGPGETVRGDGAIAGARVERLVEDGADLGYDVAVRVVFRQQAPAAQQVSRVAILANDSPICLFNTIAHATACGPSCTPVAPNASEVWSRCRPPGHLGTHPHKGRGAIPAHVNPDCIAFDSVPPKSSPAMAEQAGAVAIRRTALTH